MKKNGFTLAEAIIAFGVIGIIATIGLSGLKNAIWTQQRNAGLKATYSKLNDAWNLAVQDMEYAPKCAYWGPGNGANPSPVPVDTVIDPVTGQKRWYVKGTKDPLPDTHNGLFTHCEDFGKAIINRLVVTQTCLGSAVAQGCTPKYEGNDAVAAWNGKEGKEIVTAVSGMGGFKSSNMNNSNHAFVLEDGSIIVGYFSTKYFHPRIFAVDINGHKGPNKWGFDLFAFKSQFGYDGKKINIVGVSMPTIQGGVNPQDVLAGRK